jgi:hypothetical protein
MPPIQADGSNEAVDRVTPLLQTAFGSQMKSAEFVKSTVLAFGNMCNHPLQNQLPNAVFYEVYGSAVPVHLRKFLPCRVRVGSNESNEIHQQVLDDTKFIVLASLRRIEDEEIYVDYGASGDCPVWYHKMVGVSWKVNGKKPSS